MALKRNRTWILMALKKKYAKPIILHLEQKLDMLYDCSPQQRMVNMLKVI